MRVYMACCVVIIISFGSALCLAGCPLEVAFAKSGQVLGNTLSFGIAIGDADLDGDNDIFMANYIGSSQLWLNNGNGVFSLSPQSFGISEVHDVALGDLNGDSYPDIFLLSHAGPSKVYFNDGDGTYTAGAQAIGAGADYPGHIEIGDVDNDGDTDAFISYNTLPTRLWRNDGTGVFSMNSAESFGGNGWGIELADFNGDTFLDLFITFSDQPDEIWINDGTGHFANSGQELGNSAGYENTSSGDVDGDGDVDLAVGNSVSGVKIWLNQNNTGSFVEAGPYFEAGTPKIKLFDADLDGDLDLITAHPSNGNELWINNGLGTFTWSGLVFGSTRVVSPACGKLDKDDDFDVVLGVIENSGGNPIYFNESVDTCHGTVTDIDGNVYRTITIGTQVWMAENLKVTHYRNGDPVANVTDSVSWVGQTGGAYCNYSNDSANVATYGRLYNWYAATDGRMMAPAGWHVPTDAEWQTLVDYLGGGAVAGWKIKETGTTHWVPPNSGSNVSGFTALPGGYRGSAYAVFADMGNYATFWTATSTTSTHAWYRSLSYNLPEVARYDSRKYYGFSIRCVRDTSCCRGITGNVDCDPLDGIDISDLSALIDNLYITLGPLCCDSEANTDGQPGIDISDLSALVDYLYISFTPTAACMQPAPKVRERCRNHKGFDSIKYAAGGGDHCALEQKERLRGPSRKSSLRCLYAVDLRSIP